MGGGGGRGEVCLWVVGRKGQCVDAWLIERGNPVCGCWMVGSVYGWLNGWAKGWVVG